ncbi:SusC/RagA family TonB-linked outer membrane protein [Sphingobacterium phlebotomi]|nr:SusC/RagA family TonB-linked outer membrane protein [Sphingobacterium phlebotomi]
MRVNLICGVLLTLTINLLASNSILGQNIHTNTVELGIRTTTLKAALQQLEVETGMSIFYPSEIVDRYGAPILPAQKRTIAETLDLLLQGKSLGYSQRGTSIVLFEKHMSFERGDQTAQHRVVNGQVLDVLGKPLGGVSVYIRNWQRLPQELRNVSSTATDENGIWSLPVPSDTTFLVFSFIGYEKQEIRVGNRSSLAVMLEPDQAMLIEDVVVTGLFERPKEVYTGAVRSFNQEELQQVAGNNVLTALKSLDPSFQMPENINLGSNPNALPEVTLRGGNSLVDPGGATTSPFNYETAPNTPLFILDGFEVSLTRINDLDLTRIKSVDLLKDATATAIYGSRAANGVVVIETIRPEAGDLRVTYTGNMSLESVDLKDYNLLNAREKLNIEEQTGVYLFWGDTRTEQRLEHYYNHRLAEIQRGVNTDWTTLPLQVGVGHKHNLYIEGGDDVILYGIGGTYLNTEGVMKGSNRQNILGNAYLSYRKNGLNVRNEITITSNVGNNSPYGTFQQYTRLNPYWTPYNDDGSLKYFLETVYDGEGNRLTNFDNYDNLDGNTTDPTVRPTNPLYNADLGVKDQTRYTNLMNNTALQWQVNPWLRLTGSVALQFQWDESDRFLPAQHTSFANTPTFEKGSYDKGHGKRINYDVNLGANFNKAIDKHLLFGTLGFNAQQVRSYTNLYTVIGFPNARLDDITQGLGFRDDSRVTGEENFTRLLGGFANASYAYDNRFLADMSFRLDGSSQFGANNRIAPFWSLGAGWNVHNEPWLKDTDWLDMFRLRYSFGYTGSQNFSSYLARTTSRFYNGSDYRGMIGSYLLGFGNDDLSWQKTQKNNFGFDINIFNRLNIVGNYYIETTQGSIGDVNTAPSSGFTSYSENIGDMRTKGYELYVRYNIMNSPGNRNNWSVFANLFHVDNEITKLSSTLEALNARADTTFSSIPITRYAVGQSTNAIWAVRSRGIDPATGYEIFEKQDGTLTNIYHPRDQVIIANGRPKLEGTFGTNFEYKGIGANVFLRFRIGGYAYNQTLVDRVENAEVNMYNVDRRVAEERWMQPGDITFFKGLIDYSGRTITTPTRSSSRFVQRNDLLSLESISVYYRFSDALNKRLSLSNTRVTLFSNELYQWSAIQRERGLDYPFSRTFTLQVSTSF